MRKHISTGGHAAGALCAVTASFGWSVALRWTQAAVGCRAPHTKVPLQPPSRDTAGRAVMASQELTPKLCYVAHLHTEEEVGAQSLPDDVLASILSQLPQKQRCPGQPAALSPALLLPARLAH